MWNPDTSVIFGGRGNDDELLNDLWVITALEDSIRWTQVLSPIFLRHRTYSPPITPLQSTQLFSEKCVVVADQSFESYSPSPRECHCAAIVNSQFIIFGGMSLDGGITNISAVEVFDLLNGSWRYYETTGHGPTSPIIGGSAHAIEISSNVVVVSTDFGGVFNELFVLTMKDESATLQNSYSFMWTKVQLAWRGDWGSVPGMCLFHGAAIDSGTMLYVYGGHAGDNVAKKGLIVIDCSPLQYSNCDQFESHSNRVESDDSENISVNDDENIVYSESQCTNFYPKTVKGSSASSMTGVSTSAAPLPRTNHSALEELRESASAKNLNLFFDGINKSASEHYALSRRNHSKKS